MAVYDMVGNDLSYVLQSLNMPDKVINTNCDHVSLFFYIPFFGGTFRKGSLTRKMQNRGTEKANGSWGDRKQRHSTGKTETYETVLLRVQLFGFHCNPLYITAMQRS